MDALNRAVGEEPLMGCILSLPSWRKRLTRRKLPGRNPGVAAAATFWPALRGLPTLRPRPVPTPLQRRHIRTIAEGAAGAFGVCNHNLSRGERRQTLFCRVA